MREMKHLLSCVDRIFESRELANLMVKVGVGDREICQIKRSSEDRELTETTLFDMASVTKVVVTASLALLAIDKGLIATDDKVSRFFDVPPDKAQLTVGHLLTHTMGIGHKKLVGGGAYETIQDHILSIPSDVAIGGEVRYSCPGFILLGRILEQTFGDGLDVLFQRLVAAPLGMLRSGFYPDLSADIVNANLDDGEGGIVNDYNCRYLGGACGNAGLFSCLEDMTRYAHMLINRGSPLLSEQVFDLAVKNYTPNSSESRGLGFLYVDGRYEQTGGLFPEGSIGHCGHTGQSVFADPRSGLYVIVLSDATVSMMRKYGRENYGAVKQMRHDIHEAIKKDIQK